MARTTRLSLNSRPRGMTKVEVMNSTDIYAFRPPNGRSSTDYPKSLGTARPGNERVIVKTCPMQVAGSGLSGGSHHGVQRPDHIKLMAAMTLLQLSVSQYSSQGSVRKPTRKQPCPIGRIDASEQMLMMLADVKPRG